MNILAMLLSLLFVNTGYHVENIQYLNNNSTIQVSLDEVDKNEAAYYQRALHVIQTISFVNSQKDIVRLDIVDRDADIWRYPNYSFNGFPNKQIEITNTLFSYEQQSYSFVIDEEFAFLNKVIIGKHFTNFSFEIGKSKVFGFGEKVGPLFLGETFPINTPHTYTFFNKDQQSPISKGESGKNVYSTHPFGLFYNQKANLFSGVFYRTSNAFDLSITHSNTNTFISFISTCNYVELYLFTKSPSVDYIVKNYHTLIGRPYLPPFWSLGYHACNWGWRSVNDLENVLNGYETNKMPVDAIWTDIDYMEGYEDFTVNDRFSTLLNFTQKLHDYGIKYVPIIDAGVKTKRDSIYTLKGYEDDCFVKSAITNRPLEGTVWPGNANFLDWFNPNATKLWHMGLTNLRKKALFDGIWLDMNEVANFCDAECPGYFGNEIPYTSKNSPFFESRHHSREEFMHLGKVPGKLPLFSFTISMEGYHYSTSTNEDVHLKQFNTHNLNGMLYAKATSEYFTTNQIRPFVLTRSSFPGTGQHSSKWLGDNFATWDYLKYSISGIVEFSLYGIPHIGADLCGFMGHATSNLCLTWYMMGAFYPFTRNHHDSNKDPYRPIYGMQEAEKKIIRFAFHTKYSISHYYYTTLAHIHINGGNLIRALFYQFPNDERTFDFADFCFMISDGILIYARLSENENVNVYLPNWNWFDFYTFEMVKQYAAGSVGSITKIDSSAKLPIYIRGGVIIPYQTPFDAKRISTSLSTPIELIVALDHNKESNGSYFVDDGVELYSIEREHYNLYLLSFSRNRLIVNTVHDSGRVFECDYLNSIYILGYNASESVKNACIYFANNTSILVNIENTSNALTIDVDKVLLHDIQVIMIANSCGN